MENEKLWKETLNLIKISVSNAIFSTWFMPNFINTIKKTGDGRQTIEIACPSVFIADTVEKRYFGLVQDSLNQITGLQNDIVFTIKQKEKKSSKENIGGLFAADGKPHQKDIDEALKLARVRPGFTFRNFAVSSTNQMAWAAAEAVSKMPGKAYNPLFLWGGVGVGKTHLMLAIAYRLLKKDSDIPMLYCMGEEFTTEIVDAIRKKTTFQFKNKYRKLKVLMIDDIQFLAGKNAVQEEFFHTFNTIQREGGQIILTSDRPPAEIEKFEERLKSRFEAGLIIDISPPDFELRAAITLIKAQEKGVDLKMEIAQAIAANIDSPRKIEGFLVRLLTQVSVTKEELSMDMVNHILGQTNGEFNGLIKSALPQDFVSAVSNHFSLGKRKLLGAGRSQSVALPRQILMYLLRIELGLSLQEVGNLVGGRDHTTVMHAVEKISKNLSTNSALRDNILGIKKLVSV